MRKEPTALDGHFKFGANWTDFASHVDIQRLEDSKSNLRRLMGRDSFEGENWIDVGCGSGLSSVAAATLGAKVLAVDLDPQCVETTAILAHRFGVADRVTTELRSVFETNLLGREFDVVYSWGVLHHTGDMERAISTASTLVKDKGEFAIALYRRTRLCSFWRLEKFLYKSSPKPIQALLRTVYLAVFRLAFAVKKQSFREYRENYSTSRGMKFDTDVHDWLGGYPYESISADDLRQRMRSKGFAETRSFVAANSKPLGILGSGCDEFVFHKHE